MNETYITLFREIANAMERTSEQAMEYNKNNNDTKGYETAQLMRDDYAKLHDRLAESNFNSDSITRAEYAKLLVGAYLVAQNLEQRIETENKALRGYKIDIIPKLDRIMNETENDEQVLKLASELFQVKDEN